MPFKCSTYCVNPFLTHFRWIVVVRWLRTFPMKVQNTIYDQFSCSLTTISLQDNTTYHSFFIPSICNNFIRTKSHLLASCEPQQKKRFFQYRSSEYFSIPFGLKRVYNEWFKIFSNNIKSETKKKIWRKVLKKILKIYRLHTHWPSHRKQ